MPPVGIHYKKSLQTTGKEYREVHDWLDLDPANKAGRHDITKIFEYGKEIGEKYGEEARQQYIEHLHDDVKAKFKHLEDDLHKAMSDTLQYFGIKGD